MNYRVSHRIQLLRLGAIDLCVFKRAAARPSGLSMALSGKKAIGDDRVKSKISDPGCKRL